MHVFFAVLLAITQPWLLVGDLHLNPFDRSRVPNGYHSDPNALLVAGTIAAMRRADPAAPVVIIAGDFLAHQWAAKARAAGQDPTRAAQAAMSQIAHEFQTAFPRAQFLITMGNNDDPCGDYSTAPNSAYVAAVARIWAPLVNRNGAAPNFVREFSYAGYYTARLPNGTRAIVLNDVYWSLFFRQCGRGPNAGSAEMAWLEHSLAALAPEKRALLLMHIPPGVDPTATLIAQRFIVVPYWHGSIRAHFERLMLQFASHIPLAIAGHVHRADFRIVDGVPLLVASSVSPIYENNPSFEALRFSTDGTLRDSTTYVDDLTQNLWLKSGTFDAAFGARDLSAGSLQSLHDRLGADSGLRARWEHALVGDSDAWYGVRRTWAAFWCAQTELDGGYASCAGDQRRVTALLAAAGAAGAVVVLLVLWYSRKHLWKPKRSSE